MMEEKELVKKIYAYTYYLTDNYLENVCDYLLEVENLNSFFEECYENIESFASETPCTFICDAVTHSHKNRELIIKKYESDCIYKFCEQMLFAPSYHRRRDGLRIICNTVNIHRTKCKKLLQEYLDFVIEKDPLLLFDYIMDFTWLYAYEYSIKKNLYLRIININKEFSNLILLEALGSSSESFLSKEGILKYKMLSKLTKNESIYVRSFAKKIRKNMFIRNYKKRIDTKTYILGNARLEFSNAMVINEKESYNSDEFINFYIDYIKKNT